MCSLPLDSAELEKTLRLLRRRQYWLAALLAASITATWGRALLVRLGCPVSVRAAQFVVQDGRGRERAVLGFLQDGGAALVLKPPAGTGRLLLAADADGGLRVRLADSRSTTRALLSLDAHGVPALTLYDDAGRGRADIALGPTGAPAVDLYDEHEKSRAALVYEPTSWTGLKLCDGNDAVRAALAISARDVAGLEMQRSDGKVCLELRSQPDGRCRLGVLDKSNTWREVLDSADLAQDVAAVAGEPSGVTPQR